MVSIEQIKAQVDAYDGTPQWVMVSTASHLTQRNVDLLECGITLRKQCHLGKDQCLVGGQAAPAPTPQKKHAPKKKKKTEGEDVAHTGTAESSPPIAAAVDKPFSLG